MPPHALGPLSTARYTANGVAFDTIRVPPGRFVDGEGLGKRELLVSRPFELGVTLVTQALWWAVTDTRPSHFRGDDRPVDRVSWDDVQAFLVQLETLGLHGFRLPTEAEWAWAARCGMATRLAGADRDDPVAVTGQTKTAPVGSLSPSAVGAFNLSGNLFGWKQDAWLDLPPAGVDVQSLTLELGRVIRGGSWGVSRQYTKVAYRDYDDPGRRVDSVGFRLLRTTP
jgi:formylglycine-generating enzyme required for sulfatase activity